METLATLVGAIAAYFLPSILAVAYAKRNAASIMIVNLFLGWTFIGWVVAFAMAAAPNRESA